MKIKLKAEIKNNEVWLNDKFLSAEKSQKLKNHSPDGFSWGYGGSGTSQLSLAILLELFSEEVALKNYQNFKFEVVSKLPFTSFEKEIEIDDKLTNFKIL